MQEGRLRCSRSMTICKRPTLVVRNTAVDQCAAELRPRQGTAEDRGRHAKEPTMTPKPHCARPMPIWTGRRRGSRAVMPIVPAEATIEQIYYRPGETVPAGRPVVALLPPANLKLRFFAPQAVLPEIKYRPNRRRDLRRLRERSDCESELSSPAAPEFTPPVIYSLDERAKLVFLIEARPEQPEKFRVGQPVTVTLPRESQQMNANPTSSSMSTA